MNRPHRNFALVRAVGALFALGLLAACSHSPGVSSGTQAARYASHARGNYTAPGSAEDPWGPYIREASARFDVPDPWIRTLMRVESGGKEYIDGKLVTSSAGAMGLMQVMPGTYDELRQRHNLGDDAYEPHDNIMAGVAYMREMYDIYGAPGFLAAYNAGPARLDDYLSNNRGLPDETRRYVAMIGPHLQAASPKVRSPAEAYAMNALPIRIPAGIRYGRNAQYASNGNGRMPVAAPVAMAQLPAPVPVQPVRVTPPEPVRVAAVIPPAPSRFALIRSAQAAEPIPFRRPSAETAGQWAIQVGAYANQGQAQTAVGIAKERARAELAAAHPYVGVVHQARATLWRARLTGLSRETAVQACEKLTRGRTSCVVLSPEAQQS
jgi:hypothetical protein